MNGDRPVVSRYPTALPPSAPFTIRNAVSLTISSMPSSVVRTRETFVPSVHSKYSSVAAPVGAHERVEYVLVAGAK
jgi:hypothetical protein